MDFEQIKKMFTKVLIGSLISAAVVAVIAVLAGGFTEILGRTLFTIAIVGVHSIIVLGIVQNNENKAQRELLTLFVNMTFSIAIASFITTLFGIWEIIPFDLVSRLYILYFVFLFATLHAEMLSEALGRTKVLNNIVITNYFFMGVVVLMLLPLIFIPDVSDALGDFYFRLLAASAIVDATLTILAMILYKTYLQRNPKVPESNVFPTQVQYNAQGQPIVIKQGRDAKRKMHPLLYVLYLYLIVQFLLPLLFILGGIFYWL